ncbi:hypothetical protein LCGC14_0594300 [marine sediment metagenome]|uniref:Uncharacterized protein n=1 Tax=marine sediment metagenome TaxID=412755 RepID=A0A0F9UKZ0_9ZZZZ
MDELEFISTDELIGELSSRHTELIVIRNKEKSKGANKVFVKTPFGPLAKRKKGFDLVEAIEMLDATQKQLVIEYLED